MKKRILSVVLLLAIIINVIPMLPISVSAADTSDNVAVSVWNGTSDTSWYNSSDSLFEINSAEQLAGLSELASNGITFGKKTVLLTVDVDLSGYPWTPIKDFEGVFNGGNHTVMGVTVNLASEKVGFFANLYHYGVVKNIILKNASIQGLNSVGGIAGYTSTIGGSSWRCQFLNCHVLNSEITGTNDVGGIVGWHGNSILDGCSVSGTVTGQNNVGGLIGFIWWGSNSIKGSSNSAIVSGVTNVGGIVGYIERSTEVSEVYNTGKIIGKSVVGGIIGTGGEFVIIKNCYNTGVVAGDEFQGLISGSYHEWPIYFINCYSNSVITNRQGEEIDRTENALIGRKPTYIFVECASLYCLSDENSNYRTYTVLNEAQASLESSYVDWDFETVWIMNPILNRPVLRNNFKGVGTAYSSVIVIDAETSLPVAEASVSFGNQNNQVFTTDSSGYFTLSGKIGDGEIFSRKYPIHVTKDGYYDFYFYSNDLHVSGNKDIFPVNIVYLIPEGYTGEITSEQLFIDEHLAFANNRYTPVTQQYSFYNGWWQYDNGESMEVLRFWEILGDLAEMASFQFDDLAINADYYDIFLADLMTQMANIDTFPEIDTKVFSTYKKAHKMITSNFVISLLNPDSYVLSSDERQAWNTLLADLGGEAIKSGTTTVEMLTDDLEQLLDNGSYKPKDSTVKLLNYFLGEDFTKNNSSVINGVFEGFDVAAEVCGYVSDAADCLETYRTTARAYVLAYTYNSINEEFFNILYKTADKMASIKPQYGTWFENAVDKYHEAKPSKIKLYTQCAIELGENVVEFTYNSFFKDKIKKFIYNELAGALNVAPAQLLAVVQAYRFGYYFMDNTLKLSDKSKQYYLMNYVAPVEKAMEAVVADYGYTLNQNRTIENAKSYDYAYGMFSEVNKYLYSCLDTYATLCEVEEAIQVCAALANAWPLQKCHGNYMVTNRIISAGTYSDTVYWKILDTGELIISGEGVLLECLYSPNAPWNLSTVPFTTITVKEGIITPHYYTYATEIDEVHPHAVYGVCECGEKVLIAESSDNASCQVCHPFTVNLASMTLGNELSINFFFEKANLVGEDYYAVITKHYADGTSPAVLTVPFKDWKTSGTKYYKVTFNGIAAKEMADKITVQVFNTDGQAVSNLWEDGIKSYIMRKLADWTGDQATWAVEALNYGAASQMYFGYGTDNLANKDLTEAQKALALNYGKEDMADISKNSFATLVLEESILLKLWFSRTSGADTTGMYATVSFTDHTGKAVDYTVTEFELNNAKYIIVPIDTIVAADGDTAVTVTMYNADGSVYGTMVDSVISYASRKFNDSPLFLAVAKFCTASYNYFH